MLAIPTAEAPSAAFFRNSLLPIPRPAFFWSLVLPSFFMGNLRFRGQALINNRKALTSKYVLDSKYIKHSLPVFCACHPLRSPLAGEADSNGSLSRANFLFATL